MIVFLMIGTKILIAFVIFILVVECNQPEEVDNGRLFIVNGSTTFGSIVEYHCLPNYQLSGRFSRRCGADGRWAGPIPSCIGTYFTTHNFFFSSI
jgi:hypothetical protein